MTKQFMISCPNGYFVQDMESMKEEALNAWIPAMDLPEEEEQEIVQRVNEGIFSDFENIEVYINEVKEADCTNPDARQCNEGQYWVEVN
jgi:hypothetical protein